MYDIYKLRLQLNNWAPRGSRQVIRALQMQLHALGVERDSVELASAGSRDEEKLLVQAGG